MPWIIVMKKTSDISNQSLIATLSPLSHVLSMRETPAVVCFRFTQRPMASKRTVPYLYVLARALDSCSKWPFLFPSSLIVLTALIFSLQRCEKSSYRVYRLSITTVNSWVLWGSARVTISYKEAYVSGRSKCVGLPLILIKKVTWIRQSLTLGLKSSKQGKFC